MPDNLPPADARSVSDNDSAPAERYGPFVYVFVPFALLLAMGNIVYSELGANAVWGQFFYPDDTAHLPAAVTNPTLGRVVLSIQLSLLFAIPAVVLFTLYDLRTAPRLVFRYWQLLWAFAFLAYAIHAYYATVAWFEWDFSQIVKRQKLLVVITNYVLLIAWLVDVAFATICGQNKGAKINWLRWGNHILFVIAAATAAIIFGSGRTLQAQALGWVIVISFVYCLFWRLWRLISMAIRSKSTSVASDSPKSLPASPSA
jgi:hypothetical protein